jgi:hypothetical protein
MRITIDEYFKILNEAWERSPYFSSREEEWHPEDLFSNFDSVARGVGEGLVAYTNIVGQHVRKKAPSPYQSTKKTVTDAMVQEAGYRLLQEQKAANSERVQVFGGTVPESELNKDLFTGNDVFGGNV